MIIGIASCRTHSCNNASHEPISKPSMLAIPGAQVPYSEHSSFNELREFVAWLKPAEVIPSVFPSNNNSNEVRDWAWASMLMYGTGIVCLCALFPGHQLDRARELA